MTLWQPPPSWHRGAHQWGQQLLPHQANNIKCFVLYNIVSFEGRNGKSKQSRGRNGNQGNAGTSYLLNIGDFFVKVLSEDTFSRESTFIEFWLISSLEEAPPAWCRNGGKEIIFRWSCATSTYACLDYRNSGIQNYGIIELWRNDWVIS